MYTEAHTCVVECLCTCESVKRFSISLKIPEQTISVLFEPPMKNILKSVAVLALVVIAFSTSAFTSGSVIQFSIQNRTTQNVGTVTVFGDAGPVGQVIVPGQGTFGAPISAPMTNILVNNVMIPKGAIMQVPLSNGVVVKVDNTNNIPFVDASEIN